MKPLRLRSPEHGSTLVVLLGVMTVCAGLSTAVLMTNMGRHREAQAALHRERSFQLAEAGLDWAMAQVRMRSGILPTVRNETRAVTGSGQFAIQYLQGNEDGEDQDNDGFADDLDEADYLVLRSRGVAGPMSRTIEIVLRRAVELPAISGATQFNVETPVIAIDGNAFRIRGEQHLIDGTPDPTRPPMPGISSPADAATVASQIASNQYDNITGSGGTPSISQTPPMDLVRLVEQSRYAATRIIEPGSYGNMQIGSPTVLGSEVAFCTGDLQLSGGSGGAGVLVVDGDLTISGGFQWCGILVVRGRVVFTGGGSGKRIVGALIVGEELGSGSGTGEVSLSGTVDVLYSSDAVNLASQRLAIMSVMTWRELGANP